MHSRLFAAFSGLMICAMILSACGPAATPVPPTAAPAQPQTQPTQPPPPTKPPEPTKPPAPTATPKPKVVRVAFTEEPDNLNPLYTNMWFVQTLIGLYLNTGLISYNEKNEPIPWIAKEIPSKENGGISADGKTITYKLRQDIKWSDGEPLTANDYVFTWQMIMADKNTVNSRDPFDKYVDKVEAPDPYTLVVTFKELYAPWQAKIFSATGGMNPAIPKHILEPVFQKDGTLDKAEWNRKPTVGVGPFLFKEWQSGSDLIFTANKDFWLGKPKVDQIFIKIVPDDAAQVAALKAGDTDIGVFISYSDMPDLEKLGTLNLVVEQSGYKESWFFNMSTDPKTKGHPALQDPNVRKAIVMAVDRQKITQDIAYGKTKPAITFWDGTPYADPSIQPIPFDKAGAQKLLDDAGWKVGADGIREKGSVKLKLRYRTTTRPDRKNTQVIVQQMLKDVGIDVELLNDSSDVFFNGYGDKGPIATGQYDIVEYSANPAFPDPDSPDWRCKEIPTDKNPAGTNWEFICDKELDDLFDKSTAAVDPKDRIPMFFQIEKIISDKVYWISMWDDPDTYAVSKNLLNVKFSGAVPFWNAYEWDLKQ